MRLFWSESVAGVINWSLAAPLFSINYVLLDAVLQRSLRPIKQSPQPEGRRRVWSRRACGCCAGACGWPRSSIRSCASRPIPAGTIRTARSARASSIGAGRDPDPGGVPALQPRPVPRASRLRLAAHPDLVRPHGAEGRESRQPVVPRRRPGGRSGGAFRRAQRPHPRHPRRHPPLHDLGAAADPLLHPARERVGLRLDGRREARARRRPDARARPHAGPSLRRRRSRSSPRSRSRSSPASAARPATPAPWLAGAPPELARNPRSYVFNNGAVGVELFRDGRGAAYVMGAERGGGGIDLIRRPLDPLQARGHFFYVTEDGDAPWSIGFEPARRAGDYRIEEPGFHRLAIVHAVNGIEARMEIGPDPRQAAVLSWKIRLTDRSGAGAAPAAHELLRSRRPRDGRLRPRPRFRRHACRDGLRPGAQRDPRPQPAAALGARRPRRDGVLRGEARAGRRARRLRGFAHPLPRRRLAGRARPAASPGAGASSTTRASSGPSIRPRASPSR